jgi:hypothetical protein
MVSRSIRTGKRNALLYSGIEVKKKKAEGEEAKKRSISEEGRQLGRDRESLLTWPAPQG